MNIALVLLVAGFLICAGIVLSVQWRRDRQQCSDGGGGGQRAGHVTGWLRRVAVFVLVAVVAAGVFWACWMLGGMPSGI